MVWGSIIGAVGSIAGGLLSSKGSKDAAKESADSGLKAARINTQFQKEFAQQGVRWRVADAKASGINPLVALGANTHSYTPSYVGTNYGDGGSSQLGNAVANAGQDIGRAVRSTMTRTERKIDLDHKRQMQLLSENRAKAENRLLDYEIIKQTRDLLNSPPMPGGPAGIMAGQTGVNQVPAEQVISGSVGVEKSPRPMQKMTVGQNGRIYFPLGKAAEEALENDPLVKYRYMGDRTMDMFRRVGTGALDLLVNNPAHDKYVAEKKTFIARELGLKPSDIGYRWHLDQFFIKKSARSRLNRGR